MIAESILQQSSQQQQSKTLIKNKIENPIPKMRKLHIL